MRAQVSTEGVAKRLSVRLAASHLSLGLPASGLLNPLKTESEKTLEK
jgi:hypothetical protein